MSRAGVLSPARVFISCSNCVATCCGAAKRVQRTPPYALCNCTRFAETKCERSEVDQADSAMISPTQKQRHLAWWRQPLALIMSIGTRFRPLPQKRCTTYKILMLFRLCIVFLLDINQLIITLWKNLYHSVHYIIFFTLSLYRN